tara:strand:+ start:68 stop:499 length:432 start_codon:yes stop_codon:yes gene_type:complete
MRKDQIFVLMLVVLLPLTGCFDGGGIGDADAQETDENDQNTVIETDYYTIHLEANEDYAHSVNNSMLKIETVFQYSGGSNSLRSINGGTIDIACSLSGSFSVYATVGDIIPTIPNETCEITFNGRSDGKMIFILSEHIGEVLY